MNSKDLITPQAIPTEVTIGQSLDAEAFDMSAPNQVMVAMMHLTFSKAKSIATEAIATVYGDGEISDSRKAERIGNQALKDNGIIATGLTVGDIIYRSLYRQGFLQKTNPEPEFTSHFKADPQDMEFLRRIAQIGKAYFEGANQRDQNQSLYHTFQLANRGGSEVTFAFLQPLIRSHILLELLQQSDQPMTMHQLSSSLTALNKPMAVSEAIVDLQRNGVIAIDDTMQVKLTEDLGIYIAIDYLQPLFEATAAYCETNTGATGRRTTAE